MSNNHELGAVARHARLSLLAAAGAVLLVACGQQAADYEATRAAIQPVARVELKAVKVEPGSRTGEEIYNGVCTTCHANGTLNSPPTGDAAAWAPRIATGFDAMVSSVINGKNAMPPRGGQNDLTDDEVRRAVAYLANKAGGDFTEPPIAEPAQ